MNANAVTTVLPGLENALTVGEVAPTTTVRLERDFIVDEDGNCTAEVLADGSLARYAHPWVIGSPEPEVVRDPETVAQSKPAASTVTRKHTTLADKQARALCDAIAKAGNPDIANFLLHKWFPGKSCEFIARAYEASKVKGARCILAMLDYEKQQLTTFGSWSKLPSKVRRALS